MFNLQFSSHIYLLLILAHLLEFVLCVHRCQERREDLLFIICVSSITGIVLDWWWAGEWCTCHLPTKHKYMLQLLYAAYLWKLEAAHHDLFLVLLEDTVTLPSNLCS